MTDITDYDGSVLTYTYDDVGNVTSMNDYHGNLTSYTYTDLNQLDTLTAPGSKVWDWSYDDAGRLTDITDYDGSVLTYAYDDVGNVTSMNDYHGNVTSYTYTDLNQLDTLTAPGSKVWDWTYDAAGRPTQYTHPNGMTTAYDYDTRGRLAEIAHKDGATVKQSFDYTLDALGQIAQIYHEDGSAWDYDYDGRGRLTVAVRYDNTDTEEYREAYTYDDGDNMLTKDVTPAGQSTVTTTFTNNDANELISLTDGTNTTSFTYDDWGRQVSKAAGVYSASYNYHYGSRVIDAQSNFPGESVVTYEFGGDRKLRERSSGSEYAWYNWSFGMVPISEEDSDGFLTSTFVGTGSIALAQIDGSNPALNDASYFAFNNLQSSTSVFDKNRVLLGKSEKTPYGASYLDTFPSGVNDRYAGMPYDPAIAAYRGTYRHYSPATSRWNRPDPLGFVDGPNVYHYVKNRPTMLIDPTGTQSMPPTNSQLCDTCDGTYKDNILMLSVSFGVALALLMEWQTVQTLLCYASPDPAGCIQDVSNRFTQRHLDLLNWYTDEVDGQRRRFANCVKAFCDCEETQQYLATYPWLADYGL